MIGFFFVFRLILICLIQKEHKRKDAAPQSCHLTESGRFALSHYLTLGRACNICTEMQRLHKIVLFSGNLSSICRRCLQRTANTDRREIGLYIPRRINRKAIKIPHSRGFLTLHCLYFIRILSPRLPQYCNRIRKRAGNKRNISQISLIVFVALYNLAICSL